MKRVLLSILISLIFIVGYIGLCMILLKYNVIDQTNVFNDLLKLPLILIEYFYPLYKHSISTEEMITNIYLFGAISFLLNMLIYSIPAYLILTLLKKTMKNSKFVSDEPPPPDIMQ